MSSLHPPVPPANYATSLVLDGKWLEVVHVDTPAPSITATALADCGSYKATNVPDGTGATIVFNVSASTRFAQFNADTAGSEYIVQSNQPALVSKG